MTDGDIANNSAAFDGGGVYLNFANLTMTGGRIANNTADRNGGAIGIPNIVCLERIDISGSAAFSNNLASAAYDRDSSDDEVYKEHIGNRVTWTSPFTQGYNNYDISYTKGTSIDVDTDPTTPPTSTPTITPSRSPSPTPSGGNSNNTGNDGLDWRVVVIVLALVIGVIVAVLIFYLPRREAKHIEEDLSDFTVV
jgi:hypothetical protein